jgi:hypothetical protein
MFLNKTIATSAAILALAIFSGCAKDTVRPTSEVANTGLPRPQQVLIYNFAVSPSDVHQNSSIFAKLERNMRQGDQTAEELAVGREVADALATELVEKIQAMGLNPLRSDQNMPVNPGSILVTGHFLKIDEGNRLQRNAIGFGLGQSSVDCDVEVLAPMQTGLSPIASFSAHADSGDMPGAAVMGPAGAAAGAGTAAVLATNAAVSGVKSYKSSSAQQAKTLADKIAAQLQTYFAQQGWISPGGQ